MVKTPKVKSCNAKILVKHHGDILNMK